jgi:hypothetical protein
MAVVSKALARSGLDVWTISLGINQTDRGF